MLNRFFNGTSLPKKWIVVLFLVLLAIRLIDLNQPIVDHHSWNQISAASMAKHLYLDWNTLWTPKVDVFEDVHHPSLVYAQEFMLYHIPIALIYELTGVEEWPGRLVSVGYSMLGLWYLFLIGQRWYGDQTAFLTVLIAGLSPLNWFYGRAFMPDAAMVAAMIAGFYHFCRWLEDEEHSRHLAAAVFWTILTGLFKVFGLVIGVAYLIMILLRKKATLLKDPRLIAFAVLAWLPTLLWIYHVLHIEQGITEFTDNNSMNQIRHPELLLSLDWYNRVIFSRLIDQVLTPWAAVFALIGLWRLRVSRVETHLPLAWMGCCLVFLLVVQRGNYVHDYYQLLFVPGLALVAALGIQHFRDSQLLTTARRDGLLCLLLVLFVAHSAKYAWNHFQQDIGSYVVGQKIEQLSQPGQFILAFDVGSSKKNQMIYYSGLNGWHVESFTPSELQLYREKGVAWLGVLIKHGKDLQRRGEALRHVQSHYQRVWEDSSIVNRYGEPTLAQIYDLRAPITPTKQRIP